MLRGVRVVGVEQESSATAANMTDRRMRALVKEIKASRKSKEVEEGNRQRVEALNIVRSTLPVLSAHQAVP